MLEFAASSLKSGGPSATLEIGHSSGPDRFSTNASGTSEGAFSAPVGIAFDPSGNLLVSDRANNQMLGFKAPFADGMGASFEIGQASGPDQFAKALAALTQSSLHNPLGIAFDSFGGLWVADQLNGRVIEFDGEAVATAASDAVVSGGAAAVDETSTTGMRVSATGGSPGSIVNFYSSDLESQPPDTVAPALSGEVSFYHAKLSGQSAGSAELCVADAHASGSASMMYLDGAKWKEPARVNGTAGGSICGSIPASTLESLTLIAVGNPSAAPNSLATPQVAAALLVVAGALGAFAYVASRRRRK